MEEKKKKLRELVDLIKSWDYEYYILNSQSVSDSFYDNKIKELKNLEKEIGFSFDDSPTSKISLDIKKSNTSLKLVEREKPMLSIDNLSNYDELIKFDKKLQAQLGKVIDYVCELKIDGLSVSVVYKKGFINQISTRGDGFIGEEVTENKNIIVDLPEKISIKNCEIRGEVYMKISEFERINKNLKNFGLKKLSNPRNAASGSLRTILSKKNWGSRNLNFFSYQIFSEEKIRNQQDCLEILKENKFQVANYRKCQNILEVIDFIEEVKDIRKNLDFNIDGVVAKVNSYIDCEKIGITNKFPKWAIAYKFSSKEVSTTIESIKTEVSKNGKISYVAVVTPVQIDGSLIKNITLHNYSFIRNNLVNISDQILIKKSGDVVPQIIKVLKKNKEGFWNPDKKCSSCKEELFWNESGINQVCKNSFCKDRNINYLAFFVSKSALNMKGISVNTIKKMYEKDLVKKPSDFYSLLKKKEILSEIFKDKTYQNIILSIENSRSSQSLSKIISSMSIPLLSTFKARELSDFFSNDGEKIFDFLEKKNFSQVENFLGKKTSESLKNFFSDSLKLKEFKKILIYNNKIKEDIKLE